MPADPPFGRKSGFSSVDEFSEVTPDDTGYDRDDLWVTTSGSTSSSTSRCS